MAPAPKPSPCCRSPTIALAKRSTTGWRAPRRRGERARCRCALSFRQPLEARQAVGDLMERLLVDGVDRHLRAAKKARIVERADFQDHRRQTRPARDQMRAAFAAKFPRHGAFKVAAREL